LIDHEQEDFMRRKAAKKAAKEPLSVSFFLLPTYWLLLSAPRLLAKRGALASSSTVAHSRTFAITVTNATA
jgi:hypothetical protein